jgi:effector-binding domain-containing protein
MNYDVRSQTVASRPMAAVREHASRAGLGTAIVQTLDKVWSLLREQRVPTDHNIVVYRGVRGSALIVDIGVEVLGDFEDGAEIRHTATPSGHVVTTAHLGDYAELAGAYAALERWCTEQDRRPAGVNWEVYGDWEDDPAKRRTDVYFLLEPA